MSLVLKGIGVSRGIAIGNAHIIVRGSIEVLESAIPRQFIEDEVSRFIRAIGIARQQLEAVLAEHPIGELVDYVDRVAYGLEKERHAR